MVTESKFHVRPAAEYRFAGVRFDPQADTFRRADGSLLTLRPQSDKVLRHLACNIGRCVDKEELFASVWPDLSVTDDSLVQCITEIRKALRDGGRTILKTLPKRGYMLIADDPWSGPRAPDALSHCEPVRYVTSWDGVTIAWMVSGTPDGIPVLKAPNWIWHLGHERQSRMYVPYYERLGKVARIYRFDQRGNGMSDWDIPPLSVEEMVADMEALVEEAGLDRFFLYGLSQGVGYTLAYAAKHPERVLGIIGHGGVVTGHIASGRPDRRRRLEATLAMVEAGWEEEDPSYRRHFAHRLLPDAPRELVEELTELAKISISTENCLKYLKWLAGLDFREVATKVRAPMLCFHSMQDRMIPYEEGELLAKLVPNIRFVPLDSENHLPVPGTPLFDSALTEIENFLKNHAELASGSRDAAE